MTERGLDGSGVSRRTALKMMGAATMGGLSAQVARGAPKPGTSSGPLRIAGIGVGGRGFSDLEELSGEHIVALCDVDDRRIQRAADKWPDARRFRDYRVMLADMGGDIDAVMVATPDHTHFTASMAAIRHGKHVYCEKPLTHSVWEARQLALAARQAGVATQMGNQGQASEETRRTVELIQSGTIGPVREVHVWTDRPARGLHGVYWPQGVSRPGDTPVVPEALDWDLWLGPAPERPFHPAYHPFAWRGWWDFGTGALGDIGCHAMDPIFRALKLGAPEAVEAVSTLVNKESYPAASRVTYHFPPRGDQPAVTLTWYDGGLKPPRPEALESGRALSGYSQLFVGDTGSMLGHVVFPESKRQAAPPVEPYLPRSPGHHQEWINACRGGDPAGSNFDWAGPLAEAVLLGNVCLRPEMREVMDRQRLEWDPESLRFTNHEEANAFIHTPARSGWSINDA